MPGASHFTYDTAGTPRYTAAELSFDAFGSYVADERRFSKLFETSIRMALGRGVGLTIFYTRNWYRSDINIPANDGNFVDQAEGSLILRWPFEPSGWSPYIFGGGGRRTDPDWNGSCMVAWGLNMVHPVTGSSWILVILAPQGRGHRRILFRAGLRFVF